MAIEIPFEIIHLGDENNIHIVVNAALDGTVARLVVDTGASHSCLCKKTFKSICKKARTTKADAVLGIGKCRLSNQLVSIPQFELGELVIEDYPFLMLPLSHINKMLQIIDLQPIQGLLGSDILFKYNAIIDYKERKITFFADL
ncbi:MAG: retroviral-like aspartic protease family protein [Lentimicrobiaceae bacterium]|nr:retroviral-like aspartic protease family protein [Lentimicrobiaceae bacterium]